MNFKFRDIIGQVQSLFPKKAQARIEATAAELEDRFDEKNLISLSPKELDEYYQEIESLSLPEPYEKETRNKLLEVFDSWGKNVNYDNHLFILFSPIEPIKDVFTAIIEAIDDEIFPLQSLFWEARPEEPSMLKNKICVQLESWEKNQNENPKSLVIIPDLSLHFLRCVEGLDAIEYLFDLILKDQSRFWVIGCNQWAWNYFNSIYQLNSCFQQTFILPTLNPVEIKQWLTPIYDNLDLDFDEKKDESENQNQELEDEENNWISKKEKRYFERLANISEGLSQPAATLWLDSIQYINLSEKSNSTDVENEENKPEKNLILKRVTLPKLPDLTKDERYLLSSIGLHGEISLSALALSLGETELTIRIQAQRLLKAGIIGYKHKQLHLSPAYYSRLKRDLIDHRILAGEKD